MKIDWQSLGFSYMPVKSNIRYRYIDGKWDNGTLYNNDRLELSIASNCLHYGQAAFEGLKAFCCKDGKIRVFRPEENALRLNSTSAHILGPVVPTEMFIEAVEKVVRENIEYVPPYGTGGSLYIRPLLIGTTPQIGISASNEYYFIVLVSPVGPYYKGGIKPVHACVSDFDRAAPRGTGHIKIAGNYAASLAPTKKAKEKGCQVALFLDARARKYIEEFGTSNFIAITKDGTYVTPDSDSILDSITNKSLRQIAKDLGIKVEKRKVCFDELESFAEIGACGTAVVITPVSEIYTDDDKVYRFGEEIGPTLKSLYDRMTGIQYGEIEDIHGWMKEVII